MFCKKNHEIIFEGCFIRVTNTARIKKLTYYYLYSDVSLICMQNHNTGSVFMKLKFLSNFFISPEKCQ